MIRRVDSFKCEYDGLCYFVMETEYHHTGAVSTVLDPSIIPRVSMTLHDVLELTAQTLLALHCK